MTTPTSPMSNSSAASAASATGDTASSTGSSGEHAFTDYLASLVRTERRAALAALRRGLGKRPGQAAEMFPYIVPWLSDTMPPARQADYFLIASLFASHQLTWPASGQGYSNLGASFRRLANAASSDSIEQRFVAVLNASREDLPQHLRHAISLLRAHDIPVDWARLLADLAGWTREDRRIQRAWAQAFWRREAPTTESEAAPAENR